MPKFDISVFSDNNYEIFESGIIISKIINGNIVIKRDNSNFYRSLNIGSDVYMCFDKYEYFSGFIIKNLTDKETKELKDSCVLQ